MIPHDLIVPFRKHTLRECDEIIHAASGAPPRKGKASDGTIRISESTIDWFATNTLREEDDPDALVIICSHCMNEQVVQDQDNGIQRCSNCDRKLVWRDIPKSTWRSRFDEGVK